jgi:hypothetical protein
VGIATPLHLDLRRWLIELDRPGSRIVLSEALPVSLSDMPFSDADTINADSN